MTSLEDFSPAVAGFRPPILPSAAFATLSEGLCALNAHVAEEFMALAGVLQSNSMRARQITAESRKATGADASHCASESIATLQRILDESAGMNAIVEVSTGEMLDILSRVTASRAPLQRLTKLRSRLQIIGVLSRIEGGRIGNTSVDLSSLSRDIDILAAQVEEHVNGVFNQSSSLSEMLQSGVRELTAREREERTQTADLIQRTQSVLGPMIARVEAAQHAARDIDEQYASFHAATNKVVMSLQSEDIARQRVEHVGEAIRRVATSLDSGDSVESCAGVLALQRSQLLSTRDLLASSLDAIHSGLQSLGPRIQELLSRTAALSGQMHENGQSFAKMIDSELGMVATVFNQCSTSAKSVMAIVDNVLPSVKQMTSGASELEEIEASIHLISLNATVKTAHLGPEGFAMGVIAADLGSVALSSKQDTRLVLDGLGAISDALAAITSQEAISGTSLMMTNGADFVSQELAGLSESIRSSNQGMSEGLNKVREMAGELCTQLELGCELAARAASISEYFDEQVRNFDEVCSGLGYSHDMAMAAASGTQAEELSQLYSMESERKLHLEIFGGDPQSEESPAAPPPSTSEFGDDIELF